MMLLTTAGRAIIKRLRRAILVIAQPEPRARDNVPLEYYRFPPF
jgi:hypothetical protein